MGRLQEIFSNIERAGTFADVGCDHGFISEMVIKNGLANKVVITDISAPSLKKAEKLLENEIKKGRVKSYCTDGLKSVKEDIDECLIAGMGGKEIISILENAVKKPERLILQPMKNVDAVRVFLVENGYKILKDYVFFDKKFYDLIAAVKGEDSLTANEIEFGRTNLSEKGEAFRKRIKIKMSKITERLKNPELSTENYFKFLGELLRLKGRIFREPPVMNLIPLKYLL